MCTYGMHVLHVYMYKKEYLQEIVLHRAQIFGIMGVGTRKKIFANKTWKFFAH